MKKKPIRQNKIKRKREQNKKLRSKRVDIKIGSHKIDDIRWEDLASDCNGLCKEVGYYLQLADHIQNENKDVFSKNINLRERHNGYIKSLIDLTNEISMTRSKHMRTNEEGVWVSDKKGVLSEDSDIYNYFNIKNLYSIYYETLGNLVSIYYTDFLSDIKSENIKGYIDSISFLGKKFTETGDKMRKEIN